MGVGTIRYGAVKSVFVSSFSSVISVDVIFLLKILFPQTEKLEDGWLEETSSSYHRKRGREREREHQKKNDALFVKWKMKVFCDFFRREH